MFTSILYSIGKNSIFLIHWRNSKKKNQPIGKALAEKSTTHDTSWTCNYTANSSASTSASCHQWSFFSIFIPIPFVTISLSLFLSTFIFMVRYFFIINCSHTGQKCIHLVLELFTIAEWYIIAVVGIKFKLTRIILNKQYLYTSVHFCKNWI